MMQTANHDTSRRSVTSRGCKQQVRTVFRGRESAQRAHSYLFVIVFANAHVIQQLVAMDAEGPIQNPEDVEAQWAVNAVRYAETYEALLERLADKRVMRLTPYVFSLPVMEKCR